MPCFHQIGFFLPSFCDSTSVISLNSLESVFVGFLHALHIKEKCAKIKACKNFVWSSEFQSYNVSLVPKK